METAHQSNNPSLPLDRFGVRPTRYSSGNFELQLRCQVRFLRAVRNELKSKQGLPWKQRLEAWKHGFSCAAWHLYQLDTNDPRQYLNDISSRLKTYRINGFFNPVIDNKLVFSRLAAVHGIPHPSVISNIVKGRLYVEGAAPGTALPELLERSLEKFPQQVFRPNWSGGGQGIFFLEQSQGGLKLNEAEVTLTEASQLLSGLDRYIATAFVDQADYANQIFAGSANTLRVLTLWDYEKDEPFVAALSHRFGTLRSAPLDNWHGGQGGICASVDPHSAKLGKGAITTEKRELQWSARHPDSGSSIEGVVIPHLADVLMGIVDAASHFPFCPLIGWDVVVTEKSFTVLEANPMPAFNVWQVHQPLFTDERNRRFFKHWNLAPDEV